MADAQRMPNFGALISFFLQNGKNILLNPTYYLRARLSIVWQFFWFPAKQRSFFEIEQMALDS